MENRTQKSKAKMQLMKGLAIGGVVGALVLNHAIQQTPNKKNNMYSMLANDFDDDDEIIVSSNMFGEGLTPKEKAKSRNIKIGTLLAVPTAGALAYFAYNHFIKPVASTSSDDFTFEPINETKSFSTSETQTDVDETRENILKYAFDTTKSKSARWNVLKNVIPNAVKKTRNLPEEPDEEEGGGLKSVAKYKNIY